MATGEWINSGPLKLKDLHGRVVLIEFWTFGCINCRDTLPFVKSLADRYREKGLTVIGVHSPEFDEERKVEHLRREVTSLGIRYPIVTDNDYQTWNAYKVEAWPTIFLLDKQGRVVRAKGRTNHMENLKQPRSQSVGSLRDFQAVF